MNNENTAVGICHADHVAPLYQQKLALTSPTSGGCSVGIVRSRTQTTEFVCFLIMEVTMNAVYATLCCVDCIYSNLNCTHNRMLNTHMKWIMESKGFWQWYITLGITRFMGINHYAEFWTTRRHNISYTGSASIFMWWEGDTYSVGSLRKS
jgi:hypothetical protein